VTNPRPELPDKYTSGEQVYEASKKQIMIGADVAAIVRRKCMTQEEGLACLHFAMTMLRGQYRNQAPEGKQR